jgi:hypothetical protein
MNTSTILYRIDDEDYPQCDSTLVFVSGVPTQAAQKIAESFAAELQFITGIDPEALKVWVE